jgi:hypothetical protein
MNFPEKSLKDPRIFFKRAELSRNPAAGFYRASTDGWDQQAIWLALSPEGDYVGAWPPVIA